MLEDVPDSLRYLKEETWIRKYGGTGKQGGALENGRYEMNSQRYGNGGGTIPKPTGGSRGGGRPGNIFNGGGIDPCRPRGCM